MFVLYLKCQRLSINVDITSENVNHIMKFRLKPPLDQTRQNTCLLRRFDKSNKLITDLLLGKVVSGVAKMGIVFILKLAVFYIF